MNVRDKWAWLIRRHRRMWDLTQADLARELGVSQATVASWERGLRSPAPEALVKCVRYLEIDPADLFDVDEEPEAEVA